MPLVYVVVEPDLGGAQTLNWLAKSSIAGRARLVQLPRETKDPSALYLADPESFREAFQAALDAAAAAPFSPRAEGEATTNTSLGVSLTDFRAYMPMHTYMFTPTRALWPASSVNARIPPVPLLDKKGQLKLDDKGEPKSFTAAQWLDRNRPVEQMTWGAGTPRDNQRSAVVRRRLDQSAGKA